MRMASDSTYWTIHAFTFFDPAQTLLMTVNWQVPLDQMLKAFDRQSINDFRPPSGNVDRLLAFPYKNRAARKISGVDEDKVQFFNNAHIFPSENKIADCISNANYRGDMVFFI